MGTLSGNSTWQAVSTVTARWAKVADAAPEARVDAVRSERTNTGLSSLLKGSGWGEGVPSL
jgi:hypothetical protein